MNDDLVRALAHDLAADTADCPSLVHRVAAGVARRRRRQHMVAGALTAVVVAVAGPAVVLAQGGSSTGRGASALCAEVQSHCDQVLSARAAQALRRANSRDFSLQLVTLSLNDASPTDSCVHGAFCRGPV